MHRPKKQSGNKTQFILSQPSTIKATEVVAKAKQQGLSISTNLVYVARHAAAKKAGSSMASTRTPTRMGRPPKASPAPSGPLSSADKELARLILTIGLDRAEQILSHVRSTFGDWRA